MTRHRLPLILGLALAPLMCGAIAHANSNVAVIIGNRHYQGAVPEVSYAHRDAEAFKRYVTRPQSGDEAEPRKFPKSCKPPIRQPPSPVL